MSLDLWGLRVFVVDLDRHLEKGIAFKSVSHFDELHDLADALLVSLSTIFVFLILFITVEPVENAELSFILGSLGGSGG